MHVGRFLLPVCLFAIGCVLLLAAPFLMPTRAVVPIQEPIETIVFPVAQTRAAIPTHIQIGELISLPIEQMPFGSQGWMVSETAASIASSSALPGESGNIVIYSHNWKNLFAKLHQVKVGDNVKLQTVDGTTHTYTIESIHVVGPENIELLRPTQMEVLTIYTCTGFLDTKRLVVRAIRSG